MMEKKKHECGGGALHRNEEGGGNDVNDPHPRRGGGNDVNDLHPGVGNNVNAESRRAPDLSKSQIRQKW